MPPKLASIALLLELEPWRGHVAAAQALRRVIAGEYSPLSIVPALGSDKHS